MMDKKEVYQEAVYNLEMEGYDASLYEEYSGRGMYGKTTLGIVTDAPEIMVGFIICEIMCKYYEYTDRNSIPMRQDSMGLKTIYY